jgi:hypothetical protein
MTKEGTFDPFAMWRESLDRFEKSGNAFLTQNMESEQFSKALGTFLSASLGARHLFEENLAKLYQQADLPSRTEVAALAAAVQRIEDKLDMLLPTAPSTVRPARTRRPPDAIDPAQDNSAPARPRDPGKAKP